VNYIQVLQDTVQWRALVNEALDFRFQHKALGLFCAAKPLLTSEGICSIEFLQFWAIRFVSL
jgi:hypothetical protein